MLVNDPTARCEYTWNPNEWPYTRRCSTVATFVETTPDGRKLKLCRRHSRLLKEFKKREKESG